MKRNTSITCLFVFILLFLPVLNTWADGDSATAPQNPTAEEALQQVRDELQDVERRWYLLTRVRWGYPLCFSAGIGAMLVTQPRAAECASACLLRGWHSEVEPGQYGIQGSVGWGRVTGATGRTQRWLQGQSLTGIISPADREANYQGFIFYRSLCHGDQPLLYREQGRWQFSARFDIGQYVSPAWDESWNPNIHSARRWPNIRATMRDSCPLLQSTWVKEQRARYAELDPAGPDGQTPLDKLLAAMVAGGELPDPRQFDITTV